jgi:hypothetical protein
VKRGDLLRHLRRHGCYLKREGSSHSLWCNQQRARWRPYRGNTEIANKLARKICRNLSVPEIAR